jgi:hypothetical protein
MNGQALALYQYALEFAYENVGKEDSDKPYFQAIVAGKFAELIVEECIYVIDCNKGGDQNPEWNRALSETSEKIEKHFGVE